MALKDSLGIYDSVLILSLSVVLYFFLGIPLWLYILFLTLYIIAMIVYSTIDDYLNKKRVIGSTKENSEYEEQREEPLKDEPEVEFQMEDINFEKLRKAIYRALVKKYHPDLSRTPEEKERFNKIMIEVNTAYATKELSVLESIAARLGIEKAEIQKPLSEKINIDSLKTVLYADDEEGLRLLISEEFEEAFGDNVKTILFESPIDAFDYLIHNKVDLVISCINFGKGRPDGITFLKVCKMLYLKLPFIIFTAYPHYKHDFGTFSSDAYVTKSEDLTGLKETVRKFLEDIHNTEEVNSKIKVQDTKTLYDLYLAYKELTTKK